MDDIDKIILAYYAKDEETVQKESEHIIKSLKRFSYFSDWNEDVLKEFSVYTSLATFEPGQIIIGSDKYSEDYAFFVLKGSCQVIVCLPVITTKTRGVKHYRLFKEGYLKPPTTTTSKTENKEEGHEVTTGNNLEENNISVCASLKNNKDRKNLPETTKHQRRVQWKKEVEIRHIKTVPPKIKTYFMEACHFGDLSCFSLGESFEGRYIVAKTLVEVLKIPRHFLFNRNVANVWNKLRQFLELHVPNKKTLFKEFVNERRWRSHAKEIKNRLVANRRRCYSNRIENVPYYFRIKDILL